MRRPVDRSGASTGPLTIAVLAVRDRSRALARQAFPRRHHHLVLARQLKDFRAAFHRQLVDVALVDLGAPNDETPHAIDLAREYPSTPFVGLTPLRSTDASVVARCAASDFADLAVDSVDDGHLLDLILPLSFTRRFAVALREPHPVLHIDTPLRRQAWSSLVGYGGRPVLTETLASGMGITREHLSRAFAAGSNAPNIKRVIDLVRLLAAAELAKNPGYDVGDVAKVLGFASSSHLSTTAQRIIGTRPTSLARLRAVDLFERFGQGRNRSRRPNKPRPSH
ncbi:MAG: helix-turn-helix domain-containing protein [Gemmatimonadaceae bacterium]|nr:helix-turn-helix domain-containing protein [Gemmatimonadaceae bacterium]